VAKKISKKRRFFKLLWHALPLVLALVGGWLISIRADFPGDEVRFFIIGALLASTGVVLQVVAGWRSDSRANVADSDVADLRVAMKDALVPLTNRISELPNLTPKARLARVQGIADYAALALATLLLSHLKGARANVYRLESDASAMRLLGTGGRGDKPGEFHRGSEASDSALERVKQGKRLIVKDMAVDPPPGSNRSHYEYTSFVSLPIMSAGDEVFAYGMVTVDSPEPDAFSDTDVHTIAVVAELMAIVLALAYPTKERP
jgi:GAF domain-containing protein